MYLLMYLVRQFSNCSHVNIQQLTTPEAAAGAIATGTQQEGCNDRLASALFL